MFLLCTFYRTHYKFNTRPVPFHCQGPSSVDMSSVAVGNADDVSLTQIYIVTSNISSYPDASEYCQQEYGGSLIDNDDVNLLYSGANSHLLAGKIDNDVNLFWTNEHLTFSGEYAIAFFFLVFCARHSHV